MNCKICGSVSQLFAVEKLLNQYDVQYFQCSRCGFVQTEEPYWLAEAYSDAIADSDVGIVVRNQQTAVASSNVIFNLFNHDSKFLDYGGGYGLFTRIMRDLGFDFYWYDRFCTNIFAKQFATELLPGEHYELITAFEVFEHFVNPLDEIAAILQHTPAILFSTELLPPDHPKPSEWWYYVPHEGQHVSIYTPDALSVIAKTFGLNLYSNHASIHLLTTKTLSNEFFKHLLFAQTSARKTPLTSSDYVKSLQPSLASDRDVKSSDDHGSLEDLVLKSDDRSHPVIRAETSFKLVIDGVFFQIIQTGIARVWRSLLEEWAISGMAHHLVLLDRDGTAPKIPGIRYRRIARYDYKATDADRRLLQQICDDEQVDLFISTYYTTPLHTPSALLAYDMIPEVTNADLSLPMWQEKHRSIRYASHFLAISENTATDLSRFFPHIQRDAIQVAYCSVDTVFQPAAQNEIDAFRSKYGITRPYFLLVGMRNAFKNSILAFQAFSLLADDGAMSVVCVGPTSVLEDEYRPYGVGRTVHTLSLTDDELRLAYAGATALVYPSRYEGFGLPILEAMACGCPVITCANSSIPEVAGDAALYVSEDDPEELAIALTQIQQPPIRDRCIAAGLERVQQFSWARMAEVVSQTLATAAQKPLQPTTGLPRSMVQVPRLLERYANTPHDPDILAQVRQVRQDWVAQWMAVPEAELESAYAGYLGQIHRAFLTNRAVDVPLTDAEQAQLADLTQVLSPSLDHPQALPALLAVLLYRPVYHLPLPCCLDAIPGWVLDDYLSYLLKRPPYFQELGDVDAYYHYLTRWIDYLHEHIMQNAEDPRWQAIAALVTRQADFTLIYLAHQNLRDLYIKRAAIMEWALQQQGHTLDHAFLPHPTPRTQLRLGILATHLAPLTETFATLPIFQHLNRDRVQIIVFVLQSHNHRLERYASGHADALVQLPDTLSQQVQLIRDTDLDILFIASNVTVLARDMTLLALHRLARVQITGMNSPVTTGMPHIDYYITSNRIGAGQDLQKHYRETLIALDGAAQCFDFGPESDPPLTTALSRADFQIPEDVVVYTSGANFFKITPEMMEVWAKIVAQVPHSVLLLYPFNLNWSSVYPVQTFRDRLTTTFARYGLSPDRYRLVDAAPTRTDVKERLKLTDIYLDSFPFAGMTSLIDPLELGIPTVVTEVDSACSLGRGGAFLRELQVADLIAADESEYVQIAVALGKSLNLRQQKRIQIQQAMQTRPSFLDSRLHAQQLTAVFESLHQQEQAAALNRTFRLRDCNAIAFPDWHQAEDELFDSLVELLRWAFTCPNPHTMTLLIHSGDWDEEDANDAISSVVLHLMVEEAIDAEDSTELVLVNAQTLGESLLARLSYRIPLTPENSQAVIRSRATQLPLWDMDSDQ